MKRWITLWAVSIPVFLISYIGSFFMTSKISILPQEECKPRFIFTPQDVSYCSDIYPIDIFLISLKTQPLAYVCVASGLYIVGFMGYFIYQKVKKKNWILKRWLHIEVRKKRNERDRSQCFYYSLSDVRIVLFDLS